MIRIAIHNDQGEFAEVMIPDAHAPALKSAVAEMRNELGERLAGAHRFEKEDALTRAVSAFGQLAAAINTVIPKEDPNYE